MDSFDWSDRYCSGHVAMDDTHEEFVACVAALRRCPDAQVPARLADLAAHCAEHFADEHRLMELHDFPASECHISEHAAVQASVNEVAAIGDAARQAAVARRLAEQLASWFENHLTHLDSALAHWVVKRTFGGVPVVLRRSAQVSALPSL